MSDSSTPTQKAAALAVHLFTASGAAVALMALAAAFDRNFEGMFAWLALALFIDGIDGALARRVDVKKHAAWIDGDILDFVVDYLTYVFVPVVALWRSGLLGEGAPVWLCPVVAMASALYFADRRMKMEGNWFRGFPALWNVAVFYLMAFAPPPALCAAIVAVLTALMFAPIAFVHPLRVQQFRRVTIVMTIVWCISAALLIAGGFERDNWGRAGLLVTGVYFAGLTLRRSWTGGGSDATK